MLPENQKATAGNGGESSSFKAASLPHIIAAPSDPEIVSRFKDAYAVVVIGKTARRHVFFGLPAAQHAVDRARAHGAFADLVLVRLVPVGEAQR